MSFLDSLDGSDLYSSDMKSSNEKPKKENAALKVAENKTEALNMYLESDSARLMRTSIEKSSAPESQVEEQRENAMNEKKTTLQDKDSKTQEQNTTNQQSSTATSTDGSAPRKPQSTPSATTNEKKPLILPSHAKQKGNASKKVAQYWESEAAVDVNTRRQRYRNPHVTVDAVPSWEEYSRNLKPLDKAPLFAVDENINDKVTVYSGSVVQMEVDAIVNAANESCMGGGGVDGAVHTAAGKLLLDECKTLQGCAAGKAKITRGYNLPAQYIIHTVGPKNQNETVLRSCYQSCLQLATEFDIRTIAFCCVGVGIYGYPLPAATKVALETVRKWMETEENRTKMDKIIFVVFNDREKAAYEDLMPLYFPTAQLTENLSQKQDEEHKKKLEKELEEKAKQEEKQRLEEEKKREEERKRLEAKKQEEEMKEQEKIRKEEEQRKQKEQDERLRKEAETKRLEQERKQKEQEERSSKEAESKRIEEERKKKEEEERKLKEAVAKKQEEERKAKEEVERKQREAKKLEEEKKQKEAEAKKIEEERKKKEQEDRFRKEVEAKRIEEENRKKEQERLAQQQQEAKMKDEQTKKESAQTTVQTKQPIPSEQKPTKPQPTLTPTPTPTPEPSQGMNSYLLIGGLVGTTLITVAAFLLLKRR